MPTSTSPDSFNYLIENLPTRARKQLLKYCEPVDLTFGQVLCEPHRPLQNVYFPITGFISLMAEVEGHLPLEMALIGNEAMLGATLILGVDTPPTRGVVQCTGIAWRIPVPQFRHICRSSPQLTKQLLLFLSALLAQFAKSSACVHFHSIEQRLACWLLMADARSPGNNLQFTHVFLAEMLGVRRSGITIAAGKLQKKKLISYVRGEIEVLNRKGLETESCDCYAEMAREYLRLTTVAN